MESSAPAAHVVNGVITRSLALRKIERTTEREGERRMGTPEERKLDDGDEMFFN